MATNLEDRLTVRISEEEADEAEYQWMVRTLAGWMEEILEEKKVRDCFAESARNDIEMESPIVSL